MARIQGPNGLVLNVPDGVAADLVNSPSGEYRLVEDRSEKPEPKSAAKRSSSKK